ncbi:crossover junction endodeoxyribonuclease RuvC [Streptobacillus moniliformis]|uniref:Crossover junction endodeoxyribonuclease RuvC n=1 Tax=Streptobacillus moniliformis (strain ATCC 14647 / DSM 12112 / NCTC 10651 / 9901) TaxID=519441 RepID=D1AYS3_STRM9|nr:crossover junction endodeoxyribonuclease RuvC [Streptobacillus moniliformis]ACZ01449.1 crossover junction endodeoxyribonuclease RuvC [Streptobacillus moniliformis DSM 12112]AVL43544.1 crossover junction endodeoxyribonuclease RuvC [Streptobacillus moniliformis]QXW66130.1 crossover junction endodeoxyribonuclease RuvC [Streptobacillus moniliformis]SQA13390.1 Crossover junction endodeoxyribonuclease RuvC [Streptobacillus moniliformis]
MRVIGIDPGTAIIGYSILDFKNSKVELIDYGCIYTDKDLPMPERLEQIFFKLETLINMYKPDHMAIEELFFFKNQKTIITVAQARGVIVAKAQISGIEIFNYTPLQVKTGITGYGRAEKKQVQEMIRVILKLDEIPKPDDAADAIAIAINHINTIRGVGVLLNNPRDRVNKVTQIIEKNRIKNKNLITIEDYKNILKKKK